MLGCLDSNQTINTYEHHKNRYQIVLKCYNWVYCCHHLQRMIKFEANLAFGEPSCLNGKLYQDQVQIVSFQKCIVFHWYRVISIWFRSITVTVIVARMKGDTPVNTTMSVGQARKLVEQLKIEASFCRIKASKTSSSFYFKKKRLNCNCIIR